MIKPLIYSSIAIVITLTSCKISGTYKRAKLNTKLNPELVESLNNIVPDPNLKYSEFDVYELKFRKLGNMKYRFINRGTEGGASFSQNLPMHSGKWELNNDTLSIYYSVEKDYTPDLYIIREDSLMPINNRVCWVKEK
ncbi:MAG: hypothetical protein WDZ35_14620 [Crocinitomicaceae bacterium]